MTRELFRKHKSLSERGEGETKMKEGGRKGEQNE